MLDALLKAEPPAPIDGKDAWWRAHSAFMSERPIAQAFLAGRKTDRLGYAFASGYQCALRAMFQCKEIATFAVTEAQGAHPKTLETVYANGSVTGTKTFATMAPWASKAYVAARGVMVELDSFASEPLPPLPFASEIPHGVLRLRNAPCQALPGDGYARYIKPFRTMEDIYVHAALLGHVSAWSPSETLVALAATLLGLVELDPLAPAVHLALAETLPNIRALVDHPRWQRDAGLLSVAEGIRAKRTEAARRYLGHATE